MPAARVDALVVRVGGISLRNLDSRADMAVPAEHRHGEEHPPPPSGPRAAPSMPDGHRHGGDDAPMPQDDTGDMRATPAVHRH